MTTPGFARSALTPTASALSSATSAFAFSTPSAVSTATVAASSSADPSTASVASSPAVASSVAASSVVATVSQAGTSPAATVAPGISTVVVAPSSAVAPTTVVVTPSGATQVTSIVVGSTQEPSTTLAGTTVVIETQSSSPGATGPVVVTQVSTASAPTTAPAGGSQATSAASSATSSSPASLSNNGKSGSNSDGGLKTGGKVAIAVVVPVVAVALLVAAGIFLYRKRKQKKSAQEARRKEVEEYGYNPNHDPTLPAVGGGDSPEMTEDSSGYRGWGNNAVGSARKPSTNLSSGIGMAVSDDGQHQPNSPDQHPSSDGGHSEQPLVDGRNGGAMTAGAGAGTGAAAGGIQRGPSNASSQYSAAGQTDDSDDRPAEHGYDTNYSQFTPYRPGATNYDDTAQPVVQDVSARRHTKIENPTTMPRQGSSGIAANF